MREALRQLSESGLVNYVPRRGWFVTRLREEDRIDIVVMRGNLEGLAARLTCTRYRAGDTNFDSLRRIPTQMKADVAAVDPKSFFTHDWDFHEELCIASGNTWLHKSWLMMRHGVSLLVANSQYNYSKTADHVTSHQEIIDVLTTRTPKECEDYLRRRVIESGYASMNQIAPKQLWD
ncbi:GntR family transcriptional regulator (plasmid) [Rhodococcus sp. USK10]|nr:GntR family transcriptional regulator [Rhodococcus sp. USK10]